MNNLALFDLDHTLLSGDSDHAWGCYLVEHQLVDPKKFHELNEQFFQEYLDGTMDINAFCRFAFEPLTRYNMEALHAHRATYIKSHILQLIDDRAKALVKQHQDNGDTCVIITATNDFITRPIADLFNINHLIATQAEVIDNEFTGHLKGTPCFQEGKLVRLKEWLEHQSLKVSDFDHIYGYSDSYNDLPLLEFATHPTAVNPDPRLQAHAKHQGWPILQIID